MEYYSAIKRNKTGSFVAMWMNLESVIQSKEKRKETNKYCILTYIYVYPFSPKLPSLQDCHITLNRVPCVTP